jgi:mannose-1-phosphate guanylyltransferase/mannose-6-phosphate isomerase
LESLPDLEAPIIVTGAAHMELVDAETTRADMDPFLCLVEPAPRNTAPAVIAAALVSAADDVLVILPSDHLIRDRERFAEAVQESVSLAAAGRIVTFGIIPTRAETGYGYIEVGDPVSNGAFTVRRFKEKPDQEEADLLTSTGNHVWNSGMFVTTAGTLLDEARRHCPRILEGVTSALTDPIGVRVELGDEFRNLNAISFDHAIMEMTKEAVVMPIDVGWNDVGSFAALWSVSDKDDYGNVTSGETVLIDVGNSFVKATSRTVAVAGLDDVVVVETPDAVLVVPRGKSQLVKDLLERVESD